MKTTHLHRKIVATISLVPRGCVVSYGQVGKLLGDGGLARLVVRTLHSSSKKYKLPWFRVINSQGQIGLPDPHAYLKQKALLQSEGVVFDANDRVDLKVFAWKMNQRKLAPLLKKMLARLEP